MNDTIITERKSRYKHKVIFTPRWADREHEPIRLWCEQMFGIGGKKRRWRYGWTNDQTIYYFQNPKDLSLFLLKWS